MNRKLSVLCCIAIAIVLSFGVTDLIAYMSDGDTASNHLYIGGNRIELIEDFKPPKKLTPGVSFTKDVSIQNVGANDCFVRIKAVFTDSDMEKYCTVDYNTTDFIYDANDGFWYYKDILESGSSTPSLFTTVTLSNSISTEEIKDFDILVYTESYQSGGFTDYTDAWEYYSRNKPNN